MIADDLLYKVDSILEAAGDEVKELINKATPKYNYYREQLNSLKGNLNFIFRSSEGASTKTIDLNAESAHELIDFLMDWCVENRAKRPNG